MKESENNRKDIINSLFLINLKYVNKYSEFVADSLSLNWSNFINNKRSSINKIVKNIDKISKIEEKRNVNKLDKVILVDNLLLINKYLKEKKSRYLKTIMYEIQQINSFSDLLRYYLELYNQSTIKKEKEDDLQVIVNTIKKSKKKEDNTIKEIIYSEDSRSYYYTHIVFDRNKMLLNKGSFDIEKKMYDEYLNEGKMEFLDKKFKFSTFEKKRIIYVNSMFSLDSCLYSLINKKVDITYPVDKVFRCAEELVDVLYKELVDIPLKESVLHNLMMITVESYGSKRKIELYKKLVNKLEDELSHCSKFVYDEFVSSSNVLLDNYGFNDFLNIRGYFPVLEDLYAVVNKSVKQYVIKNVLSIINDINCLDCYTKYMDILDIVDIYNIMKQEMVGLSLSSNRFVLLQDKIVSLLVDRFGLDREVIYSDYLNEGRMN